MVYSNSIEHSRELFAVFCIVNVFGLGAKDGNTLFVKTESQVIRNLTTGANNNSVRSFEVENVEHAFKGQFVKVKTVAHIIIRRHRLWIVVDHHRAIAFLANRIECLYATPVKFNRRTNAIRTRAEHNNRAFVVFESDVVRHPTISEIEIIGLRGIFCSKCVNLLHEGHDASTFAVFSHQESGTFNVHVLLHTQRTSNLEVSETLTFSLSQQ